jgi:hypothetical protein
VVFLTWNSVFSRLEGKSKEYIEKYGLLRYAVKVV